jgi:hypothetical protein
MSSNPTIEPKKNVIRLDGSLPPNEPQITPAQSSDPIRPWNTLNPAVLPAAPTQEPVVKGTDTAAMMADMLSRQVTGQTIDPKQISNQIPTSADSIRSAPVDFTAPSTFGGPQTGGYVPVQPTKHPEPKPQ